MRERITNMSSREKLMVAGCAAFIAIVLIWSLAIQPLIRQSTGLEQRVVDKRNQLATLQERAAQVEVGGQGAAPQGNDSIVVIIDRTTRQRQLAGYLKRNQPEGSGRVRLRFEGAPFDALVSWLGDLNDRYGMTTVTANFDRADQGRVNASLVIGRAGA